MLTLTDRQSAALGNMESYLGIRSRRVDFADREAFQAYWDLIARRCDVTTRARASETQESRQKKRQDQKDRVAAYYQDADHLFDYGRAYAKRYQPSARKLHQQLVRKSANAELSEQVMQRLAERLNDTSRAMELAEAMQRRGRHAQAIRSKLRLKQFTAETIDQCLQALASANNTSTDNGGSILDSEALTRQVTLLQRKGLSQRAMRSKLMSQSADGPIVQAALTLTLGDQGADDQALRSVITKLGKKNLERRALIQRLAGKGFRYADIVRVLAEETTLTNRAKNNSASTDWVV